MNQFSHILKLFLISLVCITAGLSAIYFLLWTMVALTLGWSAFIVTVYLWAEGY